MSQAPSMPLYTDALLGDTLHLSTEEFGAYCLILFATWRNNGKALPDDARSMARICRVTERRWRDKLRPRLIPFFSTGDGCWHQKRLEKEFAFVARRAEISRANGLNNRKSEDPAGSHWDVPKPNRVNGNRFNSILSDAREDAPAEAPWGARCTAWANGHRWNPFHGPSPDEPGCMAPPDLIARALRIRNANGKAAG